VLAHIRHRLAAEDVKALFAAFVLILAGCASPAGPALGDLVSAIEQTPPEVSGIADLTLRSPKLKRCQAFDEEPTEFVCQIRTQEPSGRWKTMSATVTYDGGRWVVLQLE
jgi:hypothetical protein